MCLHSLFSTNAASAMAPALTAAHLGTALLIILALCVGGADAVSPEGPDIPFGSSMFWIYVGVRLSLLAPRARHLM